MSVTIDRSKGRQDLEVPALLLGKDWCWFNRCHAANLNEPIQTVLD